MEAGLFPCLIQWFMSLQPRHGQTGNAVPPCVNQPGDSCFPMACHQMGFETGNLMNLHIIMEFQAGLGWERPQG